MAINISSKQTQRRIATAVGTLYLSKESINRINTETVEKGNPIENAKLAALHAVKKTPELVFMAHPIPIEGVNTEIEIKDNSIDAKVTVITTAKTGVEVEALAGVMNALLAVFDMCKIYEKDTTGNYPASTRIDDIHVVSKEKS
ncbi:MAG: cyclic pyranopterin monophosphate synthase MoaC [Candidatus Hermodarchaeota archaeon]